MSKTKITAAALAAMMLISGCAQNNAAAPSESTTAGSLTTTAAATEQTTTTMTAETTVSETTETEASEPVPKASDLFTLEDYGWVMKDVPHSLMDMNATAGRNMAFILHVDMAQLGDDSKIVFYSLDADDMIYGEYYVDAKKAADPEYPTLPSEDGQYILAVPVPLRDILDAGKLDIAKIARFYITRNFDAIKQVSIAPYDAPPKEEPEPTQEPGTEYGDEMIADMSERYYEYFTGYKPEYPNYEHFYTEDTVTSVYNVPPSGDRRNPVITTYTIDKKTATGYDQNRNPVDLTKFKDGTPSDPDEPETYETGSFAYMRRLMKFENALFGVRFFGWDSSGCDLRNESEYLVDILNSTGTGEACGLYIGYPEENIVQTAGGCQLYFIIPRSSECKVEVKMLDPDNEGETLYSGDGAPIILRCNPTDPYASECAVFITSPGGKTVAWAPMITENTEDASSARYGIESYLQDGHIHDFSDYNNTSSMG